MKRREVLFALGTSPLVSLLACGGAPAPRAATASRPGPGRAEPPPAPRGPATIAYFGAFGVDERFVREGLAAALSRGADRADVFVQHRVSTNVGLEDGEVNRASSSADLGVGVRAVKGDQVGYAYAEELTVEAVRRAGLAAAVVASGPPRPAPTSFSADVLPRRYVAQLAWDKVGIDRKLPLLRRVAERAQATDARIKKVSVSFASEHGAVLVATSEGLLYEDVQPMTSLYLSCVGEAKGKRQQNGYNVAARAGLEYYDDARLDRLVAEAVRRTTVLFEAEPAPAGELPVVLAPGASGILLHEAIGHGMEADFNRKNASIYADKIGKPVAKPFVSIVDDGTIDGQRGAIDVDDEGGAPQKTLLVDGGTLATYLHDSISAAHYQVASTGSGRRESFRHVPMPRMRSTYMLAGPHAEAEIVKSVKRGIYCENFTNGQVQIGAGDFTFYVKNGYLIEDGKLTKPLTDVNLIGNGPRVLEEVDMVGDELVFDEGGWTCGKNGQSVPVSLGMPMVRVAKMTVGGTGGGKKA